MAQNIENDSRYRAAKLGALLARHYPNATPHSIGLVVFEMQRAARIAKKFAEDSCNYDLGDPDSARSAYARRQRAQDRREIAINMAFSHARLIQREFWHKQENSTVAEPARLDLGGDPRGPCGRLIIPGQRGDGWGDGFAIY